MRDMSIRRTVFPWDIPRRDRHPQAGFLTLDTFIEGFSDSVGSCRGQCSCGVTFFNPDGGWNWEDGEIEALRSSGAREIGDSVGTITFEGGVYVVDCDCWRPRAKMISRFLDSHALKIAAYLRAEKKRKQYVADISPTIAEDYE